MEKLNSIAQFFSLIGCHFQCYDIGRNIHTINQQTLIEFEQSLIPCTSPFLQQTWLAILFWPDTSKTIEKPPTANYVWFLKLPLDEKAHLNLAARDDFLHRLYEALSQYLEARTSSQSSSDKHHLQSLEAAMKDNPYGFQPKPEQMANFHALAHKQQNLPPSRYYKPAQAWFAGESQFMHWEQLGFQGLADFAARLDENYQDKSNEQLLLAGLINADNTIPAPPFQALSHCLENYPVSEPLCRAIYQRSAYELSHNTDPLSLTAFCAAAIRATAQSQSEEQAARFIVQILQSPVGTDIEILAAISGRCWNRLQQYEVLMPYLEALAITEHGQAAFNAILSDLMFIPGMREPVLHAFRSPERSTALSRAIGVFFSSLQQTGRL